MTIELTPTNLVAVPVPIGATDFDFINTHTKVLTHSLGQVELGLPTLDKYRFLGLCTSSGPEFDAAPHVKWTKDNHQNGRIWYLNYKTKQYVLVKPTDSFLTLMQSNGCYFENPCSHPADIYPTNRAHYDSLVEQWKSAQSQTSPKWAILEKL